MPSPDVLLADMLVDDLNGQFTGEFTAERVWAPDVAVKTELDKLRVFIMPGEDPSGELFERSNATILSKWPINFIIGRNVKHNTREHIDGLIAIVDKILNRVQTRSYTTTDFTHQFQANDGYQFLVRCDIDSLQRQLDTDFAVVYSGTFSSVFTIIYTLYNL